MKKQSEYSKSYYSFLSDENGIYNQYVGTLDSFYVGKDTVLTEINEWTDSARTVKTIVDAYKLKGNTFPNTNFSNSILQAASTAQQSYFYFGKNKRKSYYYAKPNLSEEQLIAQKSFGLNNTSYRNHYKRLEFLYGISIKKSESFR
ncbi:MAG: hypothetical protein R2807_08715 [Chitinophagales bacterium]